MKIRILATNTLLCFVILSPFIAGCSKQTTVRIPGLSQISNVAIVVPSDTALLAAAERNDLASLKTVFKVSGIRFTAISGQKVAAAKLSDYSLIVVPFAAAKSLNSRSTAALEQAVKSGSNLFAEGKSLLTKLLGVKQQPTPLTVECIRDTHFSNNTLYWTTPSEVYPIDNSIRNDSVVAFDETTHQPIAVTGKYGKGRFISLSPLFDPNTTKGYSRFPFLIEWLQHYLGLTRIAERSAVEMYFDPGIYEENSISADSLANRWSQRKIKRIYAAGWYYNNTYNYAPIIKACHNYGIEVYCWLEIPEVTEQMWEQHPEWREKTATGRDAHIDWRKLLNLADESCRKQVFKELDTFLIHHEWDGVNFAEMYFEPHPEGFDNPGNFTPMNAIVRNEFKQQSDFDPIELFNPQSANYWKTNKVSWRKFADYRKELSFRIKGQFLDFLTTVKERKSDFDIMLTGIDVSIQPAESDNIGESTKNTLALYDKYHFTLQIEDPSNCWGSGPERYEHLGQLYRKTVKDGNRLVFDCNVVGSHEKGFGGFPSEKPSGEEIRQIAYNMSLHKIRPAFYSEDALNTNDYKNISTVLAHDVSISEKRTNEWQIQTPYTITVNIGRNDLGFKLDNEPWFARNGMEVIIPKGNHKLSFQEQPLALKSIGLKQITGELKWAKFSKNELEFAYSEEIATCYAIIESRPSSIFIDSKKVNCLSITGNDFLLKLPKGEHTVKVEIE